MVEPEVIRERVEKAFPGAEILLRDTAGDRDHYELVVVSGAFEGRSTLQRHRLVYACLDDLLGGTLHALALTTLTPAEKNS